jgi:hypothetical protein
VLIVEIALAVPGFQVLSDLSRANLRDANLGFANLHDARRHFSESGE